MNEDARALNGALENLNTRKGTLRRILSRGILSKNFESPELRPKFELEKLQCVEFSIDKINMSKITYNCERN